MQMRIYKRPNYRNHVVPWADPIPKPKWHLDRFISFCRVHACVQQRDTQTRGVARRCGGAGRTGRHLLGAANGRILFLKIHVKIQVVISHVFACNKNKPLQLQRVPILSILGYNIRSLAAFGSTLLVLRQFYTLNRLSSFRLAPPHTLATSLKGGKFDHRPERPKVLLRH